MSDSEHLSPSRVADLVMANRAIRAPTYARDLDDEMQFTDPEKGLQWGADVIPALLGLFRLERNPRDDHPNGWIGFARHWRGGTLRLDFDLVAAADAADPILVVTEMTGRTGDRIIDDADFGAIELPDEAPTETDWTARDRRYHGARRDDDTDGTAAVHAFVAALPGWKRDVASRFDDLIQEEVPDVHRAVRYHQPFYGVPNEGWFASFGAFSEHVKLTFPSGTHLDPEPPSGTGPQRQAIDVRESDDLDESLIASWIRQAAADPGMPW